MTVAATTALLRERGHLFARVPPVALGLGVVPLLAANGGYFALSWGWAAMALGGAAAIVAAARAPSRPSPAELALIGGMTLFAAWSALAMVWTESATQTPLEVERLLVYVGAAVAVKAVVRREHVRYLLGGVLAGTTAVCAYGLATRLFPGHFTTSTFLGDRLYAPVGYWNGLGLVAAMAALLAFGHAAHGKSAAGRALAGAALPVVLPTLYFTFSRGASLAFALGLLTLVAVDARRLRLLASAAPLALVAGAIVWRASRMGALTHTHHALAAATQQGHHLAVLVVAAAIAAGLAAFAVGEIDRRTRVPRRASRAVGAALLALALLALVGVFARYGSPVSIARRAYDSISTNPPATNGNLNARLFNLSNNGRIAQWSVALHTFERHPILGTGPGSYQQEWYLHRPGGWKVVDAHNLYVETLAETGIVGMLLLAVALVAPLVGFARARRDPLAAGALAAYVAFLGHAAVDWDWELSGVTLVALLCGGGLLAAGRSDSRAGRWRSLPVVLGSVVTLAAFGGLAGNLALTAARSALASGDYARAEKDAKRAHVLAPWSADPYRVLGDAQFDAGDTFRAQLNLTTAASKAPGDWTVWLDLARVSEGRDTQAVETAARLNPRDRTIPTLGRVFRRGHNG